MVGAASLLPIVRAGHQYEPGMNFASDGYCKAFAADADGLVGGEGGAVIIVKPALAAVRDGDAIYALIRGVAMNNDGSDKAGFYAPSVTGQADVISQALARSGVSADSISYVEAHGTGTHLGDPIECQALADAYRRHTQAKQFCGLGSVKSNIGHLDTAAGLAGLIKVALSLKNGQIPPSLHIDKVNPALDLTDTAFYLTTALTPWPERGSPRRAGVSAFGIGGTNTHAILEAAPTPLASVAANTAELIVVSAKTPASLTATLTKFADFLRTTPEADLPALADIAYTLQIGRVPMACRVAFIVSSLAELIDSIVSYIDTGVFTGVNDTRHASWFSCALVKRCNRGLVVA
ncbi:KS-MAT linker domain-containing protein [Methylocucumis oryzae]|uniref:KS-MAT linker domain-containing protein n=1 Tax=Methylocucumis oryzae TaxID=1632867 RepID=UPI00069914B2|nr:ketoacyl-synthetase C-terminal extension domain-containing protein [Methylocucumis oryzae]